MNDSTKPQTTRDAILDATDRLLAKNGYKKMTIDDLAAEVGIGKGSVYLHFTSKQEIALTHIDRIVARLKDRLETIAGKGGSPVKRLREMIIERVAYRFDSVQHYSQSLNELLAALRPEVLERRKRYFAEEAGIFERVLVEGIQTKAFAARDAKPIAQTIIDSTNSLLPYSLSVNELGERKEIEKKAARIADLVLFGITDKSTKENL